MLNHKQYLHRPANEVVSFGFIFLLIHIQWTKLAAFAWVTFLASLIVVTFLGVRITVNVQSCLPSYPASDPHPGM